MKATCKYCGSLPKYKYGENIYNGKRYVIMACSGEGCDNATRICNSDPTALKRWNEANNV